MAIYGLLVGINEYQYSEKVKSGYKPMGIDLQGCVNDVTQFAETLQARFKENPVGNLKVLCNEQATRQNILDNFQQHLIERDWQQDDVAVFYFSGHGSQSKADEIFWEMEPDHLNESLVCHDSRCNNTPDLLDKELRYLIARLSKKCKHIVVFLDCCHSGGGTRVIDDEEGVRQTAEDEQLYPLSQFIFTKDIEQGIPLSNEAIKQVVKEAGDHILLSGCQSHELSREAKIIPNSDEKHGLFTYALCETLNKLQHPISYRDLRNRIHTRVQQLNPSQSPQMEVTAEQGKKEALENRLVFGGKILPAKMLAFKETSNGKTQWKINAGIMHGFGVGDEVALFDDAADISRLDNRLLTAKVVEASGLSSVLEVPANLVLAEKSYSAILIGQHFPEMPVHLVGNAETLKAMRNILQDKVYPNAGNFLREVTEKTEYEINAAGDGNFYLTKSGDPRPRFTETKSVKDVLEQAALLARWQQKLALSNPTSKLKGDEVAVVITYPSDDANPDDGEKYVDQDVMLAYSFDGASKKWKKPAFSIELRLKDGYVDDLYCTLLYFDGSTGEIYSFINDNGLINKKQPVLKIAVKKRNNTVIRSIPVKLPDELYERGISQVQDHLKLIYCTKEFDSNPLSQAGLVLSTGLRGVEEGAKDFSSISLNSALQRMIINSETRSQAINDDDNLVEVPDWMTKTINLRIVRPQETTAVIDSTPQTLIADNDVRIEGHPEFRGAVRLIASHDAASKDLPDVQIPDLNSPGNTFVFNDGFNADLGLDALEIRIGSDAFRDIEDDISAVTPENPLRLSTCQLLGKDEQIIPYAYDQENNLFLPLGYAKTVKIGDDERTYIHIEALPEAALTIPQDDTKSLGSALKIYFRKLVYRDLLRIDEKLHFLCIPEFDKEEPTKVTGYIEDTTEIAEKVKTANRILLIMHGIIGHTSSMAGCVNLTHTDGQATLFEQYDLVLTFDYENLNTLIQETAVALRGKLAEVGITAESGKHLDIVAHSMGGLVSRWFIEREGGDGLVKRLVMVGTPNGGSPMFKLKQTGESMIKAWAGGSLTAALNGLLLSPIVSGAVVAALVKLLDATSKTLAQMDPDSDFLKDLVSSAAPQQTRYAVIAGDTTGTMIPPDRYTESLSKLMDYLGKRIRIGISEMASAKLFENKANDIAVAQPSMMHFNADWASPVPMEAVRCDHLSYFQDKTAVQKIAQQLQ